MKAQPEKTIKQIKALKSKFHKISTHKPCEPVGVILQSVDLHILNCKCLGEVLVFLNKSFGAFSCSNVLPLDDGFAGGHPLLQLLGITVKQLAEY